MSIPLIQVDAFTDTPFSGNPAAVCLLSQESHADWMQAVAAEMNLSETAFVRPLEEGFELRWFTPAIEVDLCGHATLASAHAMWSEGVIPLDQPIRFHTRSGLLTASRSGEIIELDFPATPPDECEPPSGLLDALPVEPTFVGKTKFDYLLVVESADAVRSLQPDFRRLAKIPTRGVIVTSRSDDPAIDFASRFFAPTVGVDEDPVTGSAHCCLAPFWSDRLGKTEMTGFQASERSGVVRVRVAGDRVILGGNAFTVFSGEIAACATPTLQLKRSNNETIFLSMQNLVVFDVDGTLVRSVAVDDKCFVQAVEEMLGIEGIDSDWMQYAFQTDSGLLNELGVRHLGSTPSATFAQQVKGRFMELLREAIQNGQRPLVEIPGAQNLLDALCENDCWKVAIATGGWEQSAHFKLAAVGIDIDGIPIATSDDSEDRVKIIEQAIARAKETYCCDEFAKIVYVGDAGWDIAAARTLRLNFVGVGEGKVVQDLQRHGATLVVPDFTDPNAFIEALEAV